jgi:rhodanese-related sulfurtransferase
MNRQIEYFQSKLDFELDPWDLFTAMQNGEDIIPLDTRKSEFYCKGTGCNASTRGALKMSKLGFKVKELFGGLESWKSDGYATEGAHGITGQKVK